MDWGIPGFDRLAACATMRAVESTIIGTLDGHARHDHWAEPPAGLADLNVRLPAKSARAFDALRPI
jgi:hypothetical protein